MPYAPTVNDRSGELLGQGIVEGARARAAGMEALGQGIAQGVSSAAGGIAEGISKWQAQAALDRQNMAEAGAMRDIAASNPNLGLDPAMFDQLIGSGKKPADVSMSLAPYKEVFTSLLNRKPEQAPFMPAMVDLGNGRQAMTTSRSSAVPLSPPPSGTPDGDVIPLYAPDGTVLGYDTPVGDKRRFVGVGKTDEDPLTVARRIGMGTEVQGLKDNVSDLQTKVAENNMKPGPDWLPGNLFGAPYAEQLAARQQDLVRKQGELDSMGRVVAPAASAPPGASVNPGTVEMARKAVAAGADPAKVRERLKSLGIDPNVLNE